MKRYETTAIRNVSLVGHGGCGKSSLGEAMLFTSGAITRLGKIEDGNNTFDFEPEEIRRTTSHSSAVASTEWKNHKINIVDTPGDTVFHADTRLAMAATDLTVLLINAVDHIEVGSTHSWASAEELNRPRFIYLSKMDKERANFDAAMTALRSQWGPNIAPLQIPIGLGTNFKGVVDILNMKAYTYNMDGNGKASVGDVPADMVDEATNAREQLIEAVASTDDDLLEKYFDSGELSEKEVIAGLKAAVAVGNLVPVVCGTATGNAATDVLMDALVHVGPSPADVPLPKALDASGNEVSIASDDNAPFAGFVFKAVYLEMGKVSFIRSFQGEGAPDQSFFNITRDSKERWGQVLCPVGKKTDGHPGMACGDIFAVAKLKDVRSGDAICADKAHIAVVLPAVPDPCISYAVHAKKKGEEDKLANALSRVLECDPSLRTTRDPETKEHLLSGMGQTHIEVAVEKMMRFGGDVDLTLPRVPYRECIRGKCSRAEGKHKKQSGGRGQYGVCYIDMEPAARGEGFVFENAVFGGSIPTQFISSVEKGLSSAMKSGVLAGFPVVDVKVRLVDGKYHPVDSDGRSFEMAGRLGFRVAFKECKPSLMEPIMDVEITIPDECMGDVMGDINSRRGRVQGMASKAGLQIIKAQAPQAEMLTYAPDLRSLTAGRGLFTMKISHYEEVPGNLVDKIIASHKEEESEE
jgi:elongation factor G